MVFELKSIKNMDKRLSLPIVAAVLLVAGLVFTAGGTGGEIKINGTEGRDFVDIDEWSSTIECPTCSVTGDATPNGRPGVWTIDAGGEADIRYKIDTGAGDDGVSINDGDGNDKYEVKAGAGDDNVDISDGDGDDKYDVMGDGGDDTVNYDDASGDDDKVAIDT